MRGQWHNTHWIEARASGDIPAFGCVEITGAVHEEPNRTVLLVSQPSEDSVSPFAINSHKPIPSGGYGLVSLTGPVFVLYDNGDTPAAGESWGPQASSFEIKKGNFGLVILGGIDTERGIVCVNDAQTGGGLLVELCAQENATRNTPYECLLGTWNPSTGLWCYDSAPTVFAIDHRIGPPLAETNWKGLYQRMPSTVEGHNGSLYLCVSNDCEEPPEGCSCEGA